MANSVYHIFEGDDLQQTLLSTSPTFIGASGSIGPSGSVLGWQGNYGVSSSLSLYEGIRARFDVGPSTASFQSSGLQVFPLAFVPIESPDAGITVSGSYPATGSVQLVKVRANSQAPLENYVTPTDWYQEHWAPIERLYDYYNFIKPDIFFTGSYDYYSLNLRQVLPNSASVVLFAGNGLGTMSSSFTVQCWIKPTSVTGSQDFTIQSQRARWKFYVTGSSGDLAFSDYQTYLTSSTPVNYAVWNHVAFVAGNNTGSFYLNGQLTGQSTYTGSLNTNPLNIFPLASGAAPFGGNVLVTTGSMAVGAEHVVSSSFQTNATFFAHSGSTASIIAQNGTLMRISGTSIFQQSDVGNIVIIKNALTASNNGLFVIADIVSASIVDVTNNLGQAPDGNNGAISYLENATGTLTSSILAWENGFNGLVFESRVWNIALPQSAMTAGYLMALTASQSGNVNLINYARFNDGPLGSMHGFVSGSGAFDYSPSADPGNFVNINQVLPVTPMWQPNDNTTFFPPKTKILGSAGVFKVLHVPSMFYGRGILTGSVQLVDNGYNAQGFSRVLVDDGIGGLYMSGSELQPLSGNSYTGNKWRKVGNVFYSEGFVVITDPSLLDFGEIIGAGVGTGEWNGAPQILQVSFSGEMLTNVFMFNCALNQSEANASNNPSFVKQQYGNSASTPKYLVNNLGLDGGPVTYITAIGIFNENHELVAIAKLAQPIRKREKDKLTFRLRLDL
ncbi:MAG: LamG-like jellyroll fold domain-containing protein [Acidiferrobacterales bacterium]